MQFLCVAKSLSDRFAVLPQRIERPNRCRLVDRLKETSQSLCFRSPVLLVARIVDINVQFVGEKLCERSIREIEDVSVAHAENVVDGLHIDRTNVAHDSRSGAIWPIRLSLPLADMSHR